MRSFGRTTFGKDGTFTQNGVKVEVRTERHNVKRTPKEKREPKPKPEPCPHLGPAILREGITVKVKCGCSGKEQDRPHAAHECDLHGRCLPTLVPVDNAAWLQRPEASIYHACKTCESNPANKSAAPVFDAGD